MSEEESFEDTLENNLYFTLRRCEEKGKVKIPKTIFNFIYSITGICTDPNETEDFYKNPRAMFVALDLIYKALDQIEKET